MLRLINIECATQGFTQAELAEMCWEAYLKTGGAFSKIEPPAQKTDNKIRNYFHWLIDMLLDKKNPQFAAIDANLTLLAYALYHAGDHPIEDMGAFLWTLYERSLSEQQPPEKSPKGKKVSQHPKKYKEK
jgi:hypothetical protein